MSKKKKSEIDRLKEDVEAGGITLVLGSGISHDSELPNWNELLQKMLRMGQSKQKNLCDSFLCPFVPDTLSVLKAFEQFSYSDLGGYTRTEAFHLNLKKILYENYSGVPDAADTLSTIADVLIKDRQSDQPKIRRVITFNVDSLLEEHILERSKKIKPHPITQWYQSAMHFKSGIDIYHLHGFLPSDKYKPYEGKKNQPKYEDPSKELVFGDDEYWDMTSRPSSLPNVVMLNALHDSHCVFIGLSMTDPNIARWLALRANEIKASKRQQAGKSDRLGTLLSRHYWIEAETDSLRVAWLKSRGVRTLKLSDWDDLQKTFQSVFNTTEKRHRRV